MLRSTVNWSTFCFFLCFGFDFGFGFFETGFLFLTFLCMCMEAGRKHQLSFSAHSFEAEALSNHGERVFSARLEVCKPQCSSCFSAPAMLALQACTGCLAYFIGARIRILVSNQCFRTSLQILSITFRKCYNFNC